MRLSPENSIRCLTPTSRNPSAALDLPPAGFAESDGLQIFFRCFGGGRPLMMVHGWGADLETNWIDPRWVETLESQRALIAIDVRGHGQSSKPHTAELYSYGTMSRDVIAVLDALDIERCDFMGYSMGAFMGAWLLGHHSERFTAMVLGGIGNETKASAAQGADIARILRDPVQSTADGTAGRVWTFVESSANNDPQALACSAEQMWPEGFPLELAGPSISKARFPVLIVNGENDHPYVDSANAFVEALPNAKHLTISNTDHLTTVSSQGFKRAVLGFLAATED